MQAVFLTAHGGPEVLTCGELPDLQPGPGEVLLRLEHAALNHLDLWVRRGWPGIRLSYPHIPGADGAGKIAALGEGVHGWQVGQRAVINANLGCGECRYCLAGQDNRCERWRLLGETESGTYAQYVSLPARNLLPIPDGFPARIAAAASLVYLTAWHSLIVRGQLQPGESVLIVGASGGVNSASIQIAKLAGATVYMVGSDQRKLDFAASLGADVLIDRSTTENWAKSVYQLTNKRGVDVVVDNVGTTFPLSFRSARKGGRILTVGNTGGPQFEIDNRYMFAKHLSLIGSTMGTLTDFQTVMSLVFSGRLTPPLDQSFPLADAAAAQQRLEDGAQLGKITLDIP